MEGLQYECKGYNLNPVVSVLQTYYIANVFRVDSLELLSLFYARKQAIPY